MSKAVTQPRGVIVAFLLTYLDGQAEMCRGHVFRYRAVPFEPRYTRDMALRSRMLTKIPVWQERSQFVDYRGGSPCTRSCMAPVAFCDGGWFCFWAVGFSAMTARPQQDIPKNELCRAGPQEGRAVRA